MRLVALSLVFLAASCSTKKPREDAVKPPAARQIPAEGNVQSLRFEDGILKFCDAAGGHRLDVKTGMFTKDEAPCPTPREPNTACSSLNPEVSVRAPLSEPNDIVDLGAMSFPLRGKVHDCAAGGNHLAIGTGTAVVLIDTVQNNMKEVSAQGSGRVAVTKDWIAWAEGASIHLAPIQ